jgi:hypothetical protein
MWLLDLNKCIHIENYNSKNNITEYEQNIGLWNECLDNIYLFINENLPKIKIQSI